MLSFNFSQHSHVIFPVRKKIKNGFVPKTGRPNWERISLVVLFNCIVNDHLNVGGPEIVSVDWHLPTWKENSVDFAEGVEHFVLWIVVEEGEDLSSRHLDVFYVAGCDVGLVLEFFLAEVLGILSIDSDDRDLGRERG